MQSTQYLQEFCPKYAASVRDNGHINFNRYEKLHGSLSTTTTHKTSLRSPQRGSPRSKFVITLKDGSRVVSGRNRPSKLDNCINTPRTALNNNVYQSANVGMSLRAFTAMLKSMHGYIRPVIMNSHINMCTALKVRTGWISKTCFFDVHSIYVLVDSWPSQYSPSSTMWCVNRRSNQMYIPQTQTSFNSW